MLLLLVLIGVWSAYSYHMYHKSDKLMTKLDKTRSAYADLMSDFVAVHKNINSMFNLIYEEQENLESSDFERYQEQAQVVEDKIKQIADNEKWLEKEGVSDKTTVRTAILERDRAVSERDALLGKIKELEGSVQNMQAFEMEILSKVEKISESEAKKIKDAISDVNKTMKKQGKYFNPFAGGKKSNAGGAFEPDLPSEESELTKKMQGVFLKVDDLMYYRDVVETVPFGKPVWNYRVSSPFGRRADPFNKNSATHKGVDLAANKGAPIKVMAKGKVTRSEWMNGYGYMLEIDHGNGFKTKYAHLNKMYVKKGDIVQKGDEIAEVGSTGRSTGPHLHYEVLYGGVNMDPAVFMAALN